jgi:hypothetical protein
MDNLLIAQEEICVDILAKMKMSKHLRINSSVADVIGV